jgi:8-oxo-dGTP pyrophosphatase MutT (NUDIX family)
MTGHASSKRLRATVIVRMRAGVLLAGDQSGLVLLPGGGVDHGELPIVAAARELHEETGLVATSLQFLFQHESPTNLHHVYYCEAGGVPVAADDAEYLVYLDQPAKESPLNLSPATRTILVRFETCWRESDQFKMTTQSNE